MNPMRFELFAVRGRPALPTLVVAMLCVAGCGSGDGLDRQTISGTVTLDGKPLTTGVVRLDPTSVSAGTQVSAMISDGKYSLGKDVGPVPGIYKVQISSAEDTKFTLPAGKTPGEVATPIAKELVPAKYNVKSDLTMTVKAGQNEAINFTLTSK